MSKATTTTSDIVKAQNTLHNSRDSVACLLRATKQDKSTNIPLLMKSTHHGALVSFRSSHLPKHRLSRSGPSRVGAHIPRMDPNRAGLCGPGHRDRAGLAARPHGADARAEPTTEDSGGET